MYGAQALQAGRQRLLTAITGYTSIRLRVDKFGYAQILAKTNRPLPLSSFSGAHRGDAEARRTGNSNQLPVSKSPPRYGASVGGGSPGTACVHSLSSTPSGGEGLGRGGCPSVEVRHEFIVDEVDQSVWTFRPICTVMAFMGRLSVQIHMMSKNAFPAVSGDVLADGPTRVSCDKTNSSHTVSFNPQPHRVAATQQP